MKLKNILLALAASVFAIAACSKTQEDDSEPSLTIDPKGEITLSADGGSQVVKVTSNKDWKIVSDVDWLSFSVDGSDVAGQTIKASSSAVEVEISALKNDGFERQTSIRFNGGSQAKATLIVKQEGAPMSYTTIAEVRAMLGTETKITIADGIIIRGMVVSSTALNDLTSKKALYIQDETAGINVFCAADHSLAFGDDAVMNLAGQSLELYGGSPEVNGLPLDNITKISSGNDIQPIKATADDFLANKYDGRYVSVDNVQVADADLSKTWVVGGAHTSINMVTKDGGTFVVRSSKYSTFGTQTVPQGSGTIYGIATNYNSTIQLIFAKDSDYAGLTGERFKVEGSTLTVDQAITKKNGAVSVKGRVIAASPAGFVINDGTQNNLYVNDQKDAVAKDDIVVVSGEMTTYGPAARLNASSVEKVQETLPETPAQSVQELGGKIGDLKCSGSAVRISIVGTLKIDGQYNNLIFDGIEKPQGSIYTSENLESYDGQRIKATGYFAGSTSNYFQIVAETVAPDTDDYLSLSPESANVGCSATSAKFQINSNVDWTVVSETSGFTVSPASGNGNGEVTVSFAANTDPAAPKVATIKVSSKLGDKTFTLTQAKYINAGSSRFEKVTAEQTDWTGEYLIVYEDGTKAFVFNGEDAVNGFVPATINSGVIAFSDDLDAVKATVAKMDGGYSVCVKGNYLSGASESNVLNRTAEPAANAISYSTEKSATLVQLPGDKEILPTLQWNNASNQQRFRYYKTANQKDIQLYKLISE